MVALLALPPLVALADLLWLELAHRNNGLLASSGVTREYLLHVPDSYDPETPTALVLSLHGAAGWSHQQRDLTGWDHLADEHGFLVVYPQGVRDLGFSRVWRVAEGPELFVDARFFSELLDDLESRYAIDPRRIYVNGFSNGGGMTFVLSCLLPGRIAAVGTVGAAQTLPWSWCEEHAPGDGPEPVPLIAFHGTADPMIPHDGGMSWIGPEPFPATLDWAGRWAARNGCREGPALDQPAPEVTRRRYTECRDDASVVGFSIEGGGHTWPGGRRLPDWFVGRTSTAVDATAEMWSFFEAHPLDP